MLKIILPSAIILARPLRGCSLPGHGEKAWFSRFGRPRGAVRHFSRFGAHQYQVHVVDLTPIESDAAYFPTLGSELRAAQVGVGEVGLGEVDGALFPTPASHATRERRGGRSAGAHKFEVHGVTRALPLHGPSAHITNCVHTHGHTRSQHPLHSRVARQASTLLTPEPTQTHCTSAPPPLHQPSGASHGLEGATYGVADPQKSLFAMAAPPAVDPVCARVLSDFACPRAAEARSLTVEANAFAFSGRPNQYPPMAKKKPKTTMSAKMPPPLIPPAVTAATPSSSVAVSPGLGGGGEGAGGGGG